MSTEENIPGNEVEEDEDPIDYQEVLREKCQETKKCATLREEFEACETRVQSKTKTTETCASELIDFLSCVDHCVAKSLFKHLK